MGGDLGIVSSLPAQTPVVQAKTSVWKDILGGLSSTISQLGQTYVQSRTSLEIQKMQLKNAAALQQATVNAYGGQTTAAAIEAINQQRILEATERARLAEYAAGTTSPSILGGMSGTTMAIIAGAVVLGVVVMGRKGN